MRSIDPVSYALFANTKAARRAIDAGDIEAAQPHLDMLGHIAAHAPRPSLRDAADRNARSLLRGATAAR
jgi:hypothetical protein